MTLDRPIARQSCLAGAFAATAALSLPGCQTVPPFSLEEVVRRLLLASSQRAFARLTDRGGYWDRAVGEIGLAQMLGVRGELIAGLLTSPPVKRRLESVLADAAWDGSYRAAPLVADTVRVIGIGNARAIIDGGPTAATDYLRSAMGRRLVEALVPELGAAMRAVEDPLFAQGLAMIVGVDVAGLARNAGSGVEEVIWRELASAEAAIRADPASTGDPALTAVFSR